MYELSFAVLNIFMLFTTLWLVNKFLNIFLEKKKKNVYSIITWSLFAFFQLFMQYNVGNASGWITIVSIVFVVLIGISNFYSIGKKIFFIVFFFHAIWAIIEMLVFYCMDFFRIPREEVNLIGTVISKIIMIINVFAISNFWKKEDKNYLPTKLYIYLFIIPIGSIYVAVQTFFTMNFTKNITSSMLIFSLLLIFNFVIFEIYSKMVHFFIFEKENAVYTQQLEIIYRNTNEQKKVMEKFYEEKHNLVNGLVVLKHSIEHNDTSNTLKNLNQIILSFNINENISNTGNDVIDLMINFKYALAKEKGIEFSLKIFIPEELPINQCDLGMVVGNALDNAIEATDKCNNSEQVIYIIMGIKKETFVLIFKNSFVQQIKTDTKGNLISTKEDHFRHGYGISSIKKIVDKYNGGVNVDIENNIFSLTITMSFC